MGQKQSKSTNKLYVDVSNSLNIVSDTVSKSTGTTVQQVVNSNTVTIQIGPSATVVGNIDVTQKIDATQEVYAKLDSSSLTKLSTSLINDLTSSATQSANAQSGWFATGTAGSDNLTTIKNAITQAVNDRLTVENYNAILQTTINLQTATIYVQGYLMGNITVKQGIVSNILAINLITSVIDKVNDILQKQNTDVRVQQTSKATANGLDTITGQYINGAKISVIVSAIILCIAIISLLVVAMSPSGQKSINTFSNAGANRIRTA